MRSRGFGYLRQDWYSLCSRHWNYKESCRLCRTGAWHNQIVSELSRMFYKLWPWAWRKWANRKYSPSRKRLMEWFPNLGRMR
jgi:hypothetical protein